MFDVVDYWFDMGVDGVRLDAVPYLYERGRNQLRELAGDAPVPQSPPHSHVDAKFPGRMLLAEANQWPEDAVAYFGRRLKAMNVT